MSDQPNGNVGDPKAKAFGVDVTEEAGVAVVSVSGALDLASAPRMSDIAYGAAKTAARGLVFDLTDVQFMSSSGVTILVRAIGMLPDGASAALVASHSAVLRPITLSGLDRVITTLDDMSDALAYVNAAGS